jgi:hypothetical protein
MLGWTIMFGLMSLTGSVAALAEHPAPLFLKTAIFISTMLFLLSVLTRAVRSRAQR